MIRRIKVSLPPRLLNKLDAATAGRKVHVSRFAGYRRSYSPLPRSRWSRGATSLSRLALNLPLGRGCSQVVKRVENQLAGTGRWVGLGIGFPASCAD